MSASNATAPGSAPRIAPLPADQWDDRLTRLLEATGGGTSEPMHIFTTMAHAPNLFRRWLAFGGALLYGQLPRRMCELIVLRTAYRWDGPYEWAQHVEIGAAAGVTHDEMAALGGDLNAVSWDPLERAALQAVDDTRDLGAVADVTWAALAAHYNDSEMIELLMLIGHYSMLTTVLRSLQVPIELRASALADEVAGGPAR